MAEEKKAEDFPLEKQPENTRSTPKTGAEADRNTRDRTSELPAQHREMLKRTEAANKTANQTLDEGNENEVQGKLAVPHVKVMKRGSTKWTDEDGVVHKELNDAEPNVRLADEQLPDYLKLHQEVLDGADPLEATLRYQDREPEDGFAEAKLKDAELHPRTAGLGAAAGTENTQEKK